MCIRGEIVKLKVLCYGVKTIDKDQLNKTLFLSRILTLSSVVLQFSHLNKSTQKVFKGTFQQAHRPRLYSQLMPNGILNGQCNSLRKKYYQVFRDRQPIIILLFKPTDVFDVLH